MSSLQVFTPAAVTPIATRELSKHNVSILAIFKTVGVPTPVLTDASNQRCKLRNQNNGQLSRKRVQLSLIIHIYFHLVSQFWKKLLQ